jgi:hypothetical protein
MKVGPDPEGKVGLDPLGKVGLDPLGKVGRSRNTGPCVLFLLGYMRLANILDIFVLS